MSKRSLDQLKIVIDQYGKAARFPFWIWSNHRRYPGLFGSVMSEFSIAQVVGQELYNRWDEAAAMLQAAVYSQDPERYMLQLKARLAGGIDMLWALEDKGYWSEYDVSSRIPKCLLYRFIL